MMMFVVLMVMIIQHVLLVHYIDLLLILLQFFWHQIFHHVLLIEVAEVHRHRNIYKHLEMDIIWFTKKKNGLKKPTHPLSL